ncbi:hypothetical protein PJL15_04476 [Paenarthrobacter nitroguajacolicus]|nr:hypothetical protein [Paenarthrobacter nitroguajacolicus]
MVAIPGDRVQLAELLNMFDDDVPHLGEDGHGLAAKVSSSSGGLFDVGGFDVVERRLGAGCTRRHAALAERRGVGRRGPILLKLVIQPQQREREPGHVQAGHELAAFRFDNRESRGCEQLLDLAEQQEKFVVFDRAKSVDDRHYAVSGVLGLVRQEPGNQEFGELGGCGHGVLRDAGLTMNSQAEGHLPRGYVEQRVLGPRERAAVKSHTERTRAVVGPDGQTLDAVKVQSRFCGGSGDLENGEVPGNAATFFELLDRGAGDVVGDGDRPGIDALGVEP